MSEFKVFFVDAFCSEAFNGNPAAVCLFDASRRIDDETMQKIASELQKPATAFLFCDDGDFSTSRGFDIR